MYENEELVRELLEANPGKIYYRDKHGKTALHIAAQNGSLSILDLLIEAGGFVIIEIVLIYFLPFKIFHFIKTWCFIFF